MGTIRRLLACAGLMALAWMTAGGQEGSAPTPEPATSTAPAMPPGVDVTPVAIEESRRSTLSGLQPKWTIRPELKLTIHVVGDTAAKASRVGRLKIDQAEDDTGESLNKPEPGVRRGREALETIDEWKRRGVSNGFALELRLQPAARKAVSIAKLNGSFVMLVGGKPGEVIVKDVASLAGKEVDDPALAASGIKVKIDAAADAARGISFVVNGGEDAVLDGDLVDRLGKPIHTIKNVSQTGDSPAVRTLTVQPKLPDGAGLKLSIITNAKILAVPIALKDIPLP